MQKPDYRLPIPPARLPRASSAERRALAKAVLGGAFPGILCLLILAVVFLSHEWFQHAASLNRGPAAADLRDFLPAIGIGVVSIVGIALLIANSLRCQRLLAAQRRKGETALAQAETIVAVTREALLVVDQNGRIESLNPPAERLFGQRIDAVAGQPVTCLLPDRAVWQDRHRWPQTLKTEGLRGGTAQFPVEVTLTELHSGSRPQTIVMIRDLDRESESGESLRRIAAGLAQVPGEDFLRSLLKRLSLVTETSGVFLLEMLGEGPAAVGMVTVALRGEVQGKVTVDLRHSACAEVLARGARIYDGDARTQFPEDAMLADHGALSFAGTPLQDHRGRIVGVIGVLHRAGFEDAALLQSMLEIFAARAAAELERKRCEEALGAAKERLAVTLRSIGEACITLDNDGRVAMFNPIAERLTGWLHDDAAGKLVTDVLHLVDERTRRRSQHFLQRIVSTGTTDEPNALNVLISRDGQERMVETSSSPIRDRKGRKLGAIIVFRDVTERQHAEAERQKAEKLESLGLVAGGIAHDFNNLLTTILGNVTLALGSSDLPETVAERLTAARKASQRAQELASQLLTFAKGGAPVKQAVSLGQLLTDTVQCAAASPHTLCEMQLPADLWLVEADPGQLAQVIANLTLNAGQAMPTGGTIVVAAENFDLPIGSISLGLRAGRWVRFSVTDQGVGIPEQYLKKIFDPYFTTKPTGSGLGLATAYSVVKNHGGIILVESQPAQGSTFNVYLPASEKIIAAPAVAAPVPIGSGRVLMLDDEEAICMLVTCALEPLGYEVTETQDGAVALRLYEEALRAGRPYDLVISDLTMPGRMSGQEAIRLLRELDPNVRAIVSSGYANDPVMSRYEEFGFCGMIAKPYEIDALGRKVAEVLNQPAAARVIYHAFDARKTA
jgi:PAS domain S-box-containing protein